MVTLPLGTIVSWNPKWRNETSVEPLPAGWQYCDGSKIKTGPMKGKTTPNINGKHLFIRGGYRSDALEVEQDQVKTLEIEEQHTHFSTTSHKKACTSDETYKGLLAHVSDQSNGQYYYSRCSKTIQADGTGGTETRPKNIKLTFIMKVE